MCNPVGVMDSGIGGLSVLRCLANFVPSCNYLYVADHAFCPYGTKSPSQICARAVSVAKFLQSSGAQSIVVACNTASIFAGQIRAAVSLPVWDVVSYTCNAVSQLVPAGSKVALLATNATAKSDVYQQNLECFGIKTVPFCCSPIVSAVESAVPPCVLQKTIQTCLQSLSQASVDAVILGCTHFPLIKNQISAFCGGVPVICCDVPVSQAFSLSKLPQGSGQMSFVTTGDASLATRTARPYFHCSFTHVEI